MLKHDAGSLVPNSPLRNCRGSAQAMPACSALFRCGFGGSLHPPQAALAPSVVNSRMLYQLSY